jgi:ParB-like chromosome segregation protein Spo0J
MTSTKLEPHPLSAIFPPISDEDFGKLAADIKLNGLHQAIVRYQGKILDGNNRYRACELAKIAPKFTDFNGDDAAARNYVISANIHRRHLSPDQRREIIATLLKADPTQSNRQVADTAKVDHKTVGAERSRLEAGGEIPHQEKTVGKDGVAQPTKTKRGGKGGKSGAKSETEKITYKKVVNAKTALNAYGVLEEHLLDALQDVSDHSDFSQADDLARRTIEKLEEKLGQMQPDEQEVA